MRLVNNLYYEALYAHFNYVFFLKGVEETIYDGESFISDGYRFPPNFFDYFDYTNAKEEYEAIFLLKRNYEAMKSKYRQFPKLEGVEKPIAIYHEFLGIKLALKEIIVPHPDGNGISVRYKYHFFRIGAILKFLFTLNSVKRAAIFNAKIKSRITTVVEGIFPVVTNIADVNMVMEEVEMTEVETPSAKSGVFTVRRQCLAMLGLLSTFGIKETELNFATVARLIHLHSAREIPVDKNNKPQIDNSYIYKTLKKLRSTPDEKLKDDFFFLKNMYQAMEEEASSTFIRKLIKQLDNRLKG